MITANSLRRSGALGTGVIASFRLIVSEAIGVKAIDRLIQKLQIDKEILADQDDADELQDGAANAAPKIDRRGM